MANMQVESLLSEMPDKLRRRCEHHIEAADDLHEDVLAVTRSSFPFGTLFVTPSRLVVDLQDGGVQVVRYEDVESFSLIEGRKKLIGGYSETMLSTYYKNGREVTGQGLDGGDWGNRTGRAILGAHKKYVMNN